MSPILQAQKAYGESRSFPGDLHAHLVHGFVVSTPRLFVMGRPVEKDADERLLSNIRFHFANPDTWLVWSAAGQLWQLLDLLPSELPCIAFHRRQDPELRVYKTARLRHLAGLPRHPHRQPTNAT